MQKTLPPRCAAPGAPWESASPLPPSAAARTPGPIVARLNKAIAAVLASPEVVAALATQSALPEYSTPEQLAALQRSERATWGQAAREANVRMD